MKTLDELMDQRTNERDERVYAVDYNWYLRAGDFDSIPRHLDVYRRIAGEKLMFIGGCDQAIGEKDGLSRIKDFPILELDLTQGFLFNMYAIVENVFDIAAKRLNVYVQGTANDKKHILSLVAKTDIGKALQSDFHNNPIMHEFYIIRNTINHNTRDIDFKRMILDNGLSLAILGCDSKRGFYATPLYETMFRFYDHILTKTLDVLL